MADIKLTFTNPINISTQIGDIIYANSYSNEIGEIDDITENTITVNNVVNMANPGDFIIFKKNNSIN